MQFSTFSTAKLQKATRKVLEEFIKFSSVNEKQKTPHPLQSYQFGFQTDLSF